MILKKSEFSTALVKAHNHGFMQGMAIALITLGKDQDQPTMAKNIANDLGVGHISLYKGHGIDLCDLLKLKYILHGKSNTDGKEAR